MKTNDPKITTWRLALVLALIFAGMASCKSAADRHYLHEAREGADFLLSKMSGIEGAGLYEGLSGVAFALEETYRASGDEQYRQGFLDCLGRIKAAAVEV